MRRQKAILSLLLALSLLLSLCACGKLHDKEALFQDELSAADSGYATAEEAFLAYCEGLFSLDWEQVRQTIHPELLASPYGQAFQESFLSRPEYADRAKIRLQGLKLSGDSVMYDSSDLTDMFQSTIDGLGLDLKIEDVKSQDIEFEADYQGWDSHFFSEHQCVIRIDGRWYAMPVYNILSLDELESTSEPPTDSEPVHVDDASASIFVVGDQFDSSQAHCYHIPMVSCEDSGRFAKVNDTISRELSHILESETNPKGYNLDCMSYDWAQHGDILSIVVQTDRIEAAITDFHIYNISVSKADFVSDEAVLQAFGTSEAEFLEMVKGAITQNFERHRESVLSSSGCDEAEYDRLLNQSIEELTAQSTVPFVGPDGQLCALAGSHWFAGASWYKHLWDLTANDLFWIPDCTQDHSEPSEPSEPEQDSNVSLTKEELLGQWEVDTEYTMNDSGKSMWDIFGSSFSSGGHLMTFSEEGGFHYYVAWCYGNGTYQLTDNGLSAHVTDGDPSGTFELQVSRDGVLRLAFDILGDGTLVFWHKTSQSDTDSGAQSGATEAPDSGNLSEAEQIETTALAIISYLKNSEGTEAAALAQKLYNRVSEMVADYDLGTGQGITDDCDIFHASSDFPFLSVRDYDFNLSEEEPGLRMRIWLKVPVAPHSVTYDSFCVYILDFTENWEFTGWSHHDYENKVWYDYDSTGTLLDSRSYS